MELYDEKQVSKMLGVKTGTLTNWRSRGEGPKYVKIGSKPRYTPQAVRDWVAARTVTPKPAKTRKRK